MNFKCVTPPYSENIQNKFDKLCFNYFFLPLCFTVNGEDINVNLICYLEGELFEH